MMIDGTVEVAGTVKIDTSSELTNLYEIARRAKDTENSENALKYYDMILVKDPSSWEANFYVVYYRAMSCTLAEIQSAALSVSNCFGSILSIIKDNISDEAEEKEVLLEITTKSTAIANMLANGASNHYWGIDSTIRDNFNDDYIGNMMASAKVLYTLGDSLIETFGDKYQSKAVKLWENGNTFFTLYKLPRLSTILVLCEVLKNEYTSKIQKYNRSYQAPETT